MKKVYLTMLFIFPFFFACKKENTILAPTETKLGINQNKMISFDEAGNIHNEVLSLIVSNLSSNANDDYLSLEQKAKQIALGYVNTHNEYLSRDDINNGYKIRPSIFVYEKLRSKTYLNYATATLAKLEFNGAIKHDESEFIISLFSLLKNIYDRKSSPDVAKGIDSLSKIWESKKYHIERVKGLFQDIVLV